MPNQNSSQAGTEVVTTTTGKAPIPRWWPIGLFCASVLFFIIGGGLIGAWSSSDNCSYYDDGYDTYYTCGANIGEWNGGIACIVIGALLKLAFWVVLIVRCVQNRNYRTQSTVVYVNAQAAAAAGTLEKPQPHSTVYNVPQPANGDQTVPQPQYVSAAQVPLAETKLATRYCGHCGSGTTTPFCSQCGSQVPM